MKQAITERLLSSLKPGIEVYIWDTKTLGLGVRVGKRRITFLGQRWQHGHSERATLGHYPDVRLDEAKHALRVFLNGHKKEAAKGKVPLGEAVEAYMTARYDYKALTARDVRNLLYRDVVRPLGAGKAIDSATKQDIKTLLNESKKRGPSVPHTIFKVVHTFFEWCVREDYIGGSPMTTIDVPPEPMSRDRCLTNEEVGAIWRVCHKHLAFPLKYFFLLLLLTAQRRNEVAGMQWSEVNLETKIWTIPKVRVKMSREHQVPLNEHACDLLEEIRERRLVRNDYVFIHPLSGHSKAKIKIDTFLKSSLVDFRHWTPHDFRRTFASKMAEFEVDESVTERCLNHMATTARAGVRGIYNRFSYMPQKRRAMDLWGEYVYKCGVDNP